MIIHVHVHKAVVHVCVCVCVCVRERERQCMSYTTLGFGVYMLAGVLCCVQVCRVDCEVRPMEGDKRELVIKLHLDYKMERELRSELQEGECVT